MHILLVGTTIGVLIINLGGQSNITKSETPAIDNFRAITNEFTACS